MEKQAFNLLQAAKYLGISRKTLKKELSNIRHRQLKQGKNGGPGRYIILKEDLDAWARGAELVNG